MARQGKIARLPHALREQVNTRLLNGESASTILGWLNAEPEAAVIWQTNFDGSEASPQNLSEWRSGGYRDWLTRREKIEHTKTLATFAESLAKSGGNIADGAAAILGGQMLEALEQAANMSVTGGSDDAEADPTKGLARMASAITALQSARTARERLTLERERVKAKREDQKLAREKFETQTVKAFLEWARQPEAVAILDSGKPKHVQMDALRELMFGKTK